MTVDQARLVHTITFGQAGSFPKAVCGCRGSGSTGFKRFCRADLLPLHVDACQDCLAQAPLAGPAVQLRLQEAS